jgi:hypothetical protein
MAKISAENRRLREESKRQKNWKHWGSYLSERQWGTVREDYSANGDAWRDFPHDHARSRAYRWGEDGLLGFTDRQCRLCFSLALWNEKDPILKERLFGLTGPEGNHGEDVKECYYYLDNLPTHSYVKGLYKYPQSEYPYEQLVTGNTQRGKDHGELELVDTGVFEDGYFDVVAEYAKNSADDVLIQVTVSNRGPETKTLHLLPTLWFRNTWIWGCEHEGCTLKPQLRKESGNSVRCEHETLGTYFWQVEDTKKSADFELLFTDNDTNYERLWGKESFAKYVKDAFHDYVIDGKKEVVNPKNYGTKVAAYYQLELAPGQSRMVKFRLSSEAERPARPFGVGFGRIFKKRIAEADEFYDDLIPATCSEDDRNIARQAYAGMLWTKQFYHYVVTDWLDGDPETATPPAERKGGRNADWRHLFNRDIISMPDKWEYPWYAAWDLAFHCIPLGKLDIEFAKQQLLLFLREWYMHPNGQIPAYEFNLSDVNPPVHAWACWRVYQMSGPPGERDWRFLSSAFQKLLINFTWWVNRKDQGGKHLFSGGFLGLDNIGVFDRSKPLPDGSRLEQADGTAWMAFYCACMLSIARELAFHTPAAEDTASKFFEHFILIADAMNSLGGTGLWDEEDGFYYDQIYRDKEAQKLKVRSIVGLIPLFAVEILDDEAIEKLPGFKKRLDWFLKYRRDAAKHIAYMDRTEKGVKQSRRLLALPTREKLQQVLAYMLDENEFLSPYGIRSLSKVHLDKPYESELYGQDTRVAYTPGESDSYLFGGNSNWRGPIWFPVNYLLIEALELYFVYYGESFQVECPTGSGNMMDLRQVSAEIARRLARLFRKDETGRRPCHGTDSRYNDDPEFQDLILFYEYFHADTGAGLGASHQTGWTGLIVQCLEKLANPEWLSATQPNSKTSPADTVM